MFDWLKTLLFDEEEVVVEEDKLEGINFSEVNDFDTIMSNKAEVQEEQMPEASSVKETVFKREPARNDFNIQVSDATMKKEREELKPKKLERVSVERKEKSKEKELEINSVISPMFGGSAITKSGSKSEQVKIETMPLKKKDSLGTIISPIYGQAELDQHEQEAIEKIEKTQTEPVSLSDEEDWKNDIPIDELVSNEEESDDCVQFSLFGDTTEIKE